MRHEVWENGTAQEITEAQALALLAKDIIYPCEEHSSATQTVYHIHSDRSWNDIPEPKGEHP